MNLASLKINEGGADVYVPGTISFDGEIVRRWGHEGFSEDIVVFDFEGIYGGLTCRPACQLTRRDNGFWIAKQTYPQFDLYFLQLKLLEKLVGLERRGQFALQGDIVGQVTHYDDIREGEIVFQKLEQLLLDMECDERGMHLVIGGRLGALKAGVIGNSEKHRQDVLLHGKRFYRSSFEIKATIPIELLIARTMFLQQLERLRREKME